MGITQLVDAQAGCLRVIVQSGGRCMAGGCKRSFVRAES